MCPNLGNFGRAESTRRREREKEKEKEKNYKEISLKELDEEIV